MRVFSRFAASVLTVAFLFSFVGRVSAATTITMGTARSFAVLAGSGITNTGPTTITGDIGSYPTTTQTGFGSVTGNGTNHGGDSVTQGAKTDLVAAYNDAAGQGPTTPIVADLGGQTLVPGVYNSGSSIGLTGTVTLDGGGDPDAVFIFQAGSTLTTAGSSVVALTNGTQACNVFWQVGSSATLGTNSTFRGNIFALTSITLTTGATLQGRALARNGAVTMDSNTISVAYCTGEITPAFGSLASTNGAGPEKNIPWKLVAVSLFSVALVSTGLVIVKRKQKI
ncbi:MAG TPA: ice-binding family protein [Candidatus Dojkabacteria bacterium]|jgi:type VI secretion system secreted protein VgrG